MIRRFLAWVAEKLGCSSGYRVTVNEDAPDTVKDRMLYLIGEQGDVWLAVMKCPCGCGDVISLPMSGGARPCWHVFVEHGNPSLSPSVHRTTRCRSHFLLKAGRIIWCR